MLFKYANRFDRLLLLSEGNFAQLLPPGRHHITLHPSLEGPGTHCGLIPIGNPCRSITTSGLRWDMQQAHLAFGGMVSSCNVLDNDKIEIETSDFVLWTTAFGEEEGARAR